MLNFCFKTGSIGTIFQILDDKYYNFMYTITTMSIIFLVAYLVKRKKSNIWNVGKGYIQQNLIPFDRKGQRRPLPICKALTWSSDGKILFGGYDDGSIRMWKQSGEKLF